MVIKTREKLVEVARQLFAHKGVEHTTMNDIANASEKGRRTIYTYFKNKKEIYNAVIEKESDHLVSKLKNIASQDIPPVEKLEQFLTIRLESSNETVSRYDFIRSFFSSDARKIERVRKLATNKEISILRNILNEGIDAGVFIKEQAERLTTILIILLQGIDLTFLKNEQSGVFENNQGKIEDAIVKFIINGITIKTI